jgi:hypothetical protein
MSSIELHALLRRLHAQLAASPSLDPESRQLIEVVLGDLQRLGTPPAAGAGEPLTAGGLEALAVRFEAEHPALAGALRQIADVLGKAGI